MCLIICNHIFHYLEKGHIVLDSANLIGTHLEKCKTKCKEHMRHDSDNNNRYYHLYKGKTE